MTPKDFHGIKRCDREWDLIHILTGKHITTTDTRRETGAFAVGMIEAVGDDMDFTDECPLCVYDAYYRLWKHGIPNTLIKAVFSGKAAS